MAIPADSIRGEVTAALAAAEDRLGARVYARQGDIPPFVVVRYGGIEESDDLSLNLHTVRVWCAVESNSHDPQHLAQEARLVLEEAGWTVSSVSAPPTPVIPPGSKERRDVVVLTVF